MSESSPAAPPAVSRANSGVERMVGQQEGLLAVEDRRVGAAAVLRQSIWRVRR